MGDGYVANPSVLDVSQLTAGCLNGTIPISANFAHNDFSTLDDIFIRNVIQFYLNPFNNFLKMYNYKSIIEVLLLLLCMFSCVRKDIDRDFVLNERKLEEIELFSEKHYFDNIINPRKINLMGKYLIVFEEHRISSELPLVHLLDVTSWKYYTSKGVIGDGPGEMISATLFDPGFEDNSFFVYSSMSKRISEFDLSESSVYPIRQFSQPENLFSIVYMNMLTDSTYIGVSVNDPNRIIEFDRNGNRIAGYGNWQVIPNWEEFSNFNHFTINSGWFKCDRELGLFVKACIFRDRLEIFDYNSKTFKIIDGPDLELPKFELYGPDVPLNIPIENPYRYRDVAISSRYVFGLYGGINEENYRATGKIAEKIFVFSHSGEPLLKLILDRSLQGIVVNETKGEIYGLTTDENPGIAVFKLPQELMTE